MTPRIAVALAGIALAAFGLFATAPQAPRPNPAEAARLNNLGSAYMNQQLFEKGLKEFQQAAEADPKLAIARLNEGIAYLNLQKIDEAKGALQATLKQESNNPNAWYNLGLMAKKHGKGTVKLRDGWKFEGNFSSGKRSGIGRMRDKKGRSYIGTWNNGLITHYKKNLIEGSGSDEWITLAAGTDEKALMDQIHNTNTAASGTIPQSPKEISSSSSSSSSSGSRSRSSSSVSSNSQTKLVRNINKRK